MTTLSHISCEKEIKECKGIIHENGITTLNGQKFSGRCKTYYQDGKLNSEQEYKNGLDNGEWIFYYYNGNVETKGTFLEGKRNGKWLFYHENGKIKLEAEYKLGDKVGRWVEYDTNGEVFRIKGYGFK